MVHNADDKRERASVPVGSSEDVSRVQEVFRDDTHSAVQVADPPAVNVVLLKEKKQTNKGTEQNLSPDSHFYLL